MFYEKLPALFPHADARSWFTSSPALAEETAFRNGTLQGAYLMIAARAIGLDVGAMSGFDKAKVDEAFFAGTTVKSNFLCNLGHGDPSRRLRQACRAWTSPKPAASPDRYRSGGCTWAGSAADAPDPAQDLISRFPKALRPLAGGSREGSALPGPVRTPSAAGRGRPAHPRAPPAARSPPCHPSAPRRPPRPRRAAPSPPGRRPAG